MRRVVGAGDADAVAGSEFEQAFVAEHPEGTHDGVRVDVHDRCKVAGGGQSLAGLGFSIGDRASDLRCDSVLEQGGLVAVDLDIHG